MRGKLRDKHPEKRDIFKREVIERKRPGKRDNHPVHWQDQLENENDLLDLVEDEEAKGTEETLVEVPQQQKIPSVKK